MYVPRSSRHPLRFTDPLQVCDNVGDHLIGNVYARYEWETEAQAAVDNLNERWYAGASKLLTVWFSRTKFK